MSTIFERTRRVIRHLWRQAVMTARLAVGVPDYDIYLQHQRAHHAQRTPMSREEFFRERMQARYRPGRSRCC